MMLHDERIPSRGEEVANSVSHGMGLLLAAAAVPFLLVTSVRNGSAVNVAASSVFALTMVLVYASSVLYHAITHAGAKRLFRKLDQGAIFLFIAGSYTPFALGPLAGPWGWTLFGLVGVAGPLDVFPGDVPSGAELYRQSYPHALELRRQLMTAMRRGKSSHKLR